MHLLATLCALLAALAFSGLPAAAQGMFDTSVKVDNSQQTPPAKRAPQRVQKPAKDTAKAGKDAGGRQLDKPVAEEEQVRAQRHNAWTVGIAAGLAEGSFSRYASDLAKALDDGDNFRVLPVMTSGAVGNVLDLLYLNGVDAAITYADVLDHFRSVETVPNLDRRLAYVVPLFQDEVHLLVRPQIKSIQDLAGRKVGFDTPGSGANHTGAIVFERLGVQVEKVFMHNALALEAMRRGELAAIVHVGARPSDLLARIEPEWGFHFLAIEHSDKFRDYYAPSELRHADYPNLIQQGGAVRTLSVQALLAAYNWPADSDGYRRCARLAEYLFDRFDRLRAPPFQPGWREMNLAGTVPGWTRFAPAQEILERMALRPALDSALARAQAIRAAPGNVAEQERLYKQFMQWTKQHKQP